MCWNFRLRHPLKSGKFNVLLVWKESSISAASKQTQRLKDICSPVLWSVSLSPDPFWMYLPQKPSLREYFVISEKISFKCCENQHLAEGEQMKLMVSKKQAASPQLYTLFALIVTLSWHVCKSELTPVLTFFGLVGRTGAADLVVVCCGGTLQEIQAAKLEEPGLHRHHFLLFRTSVCQRSWSMWPLEEQICSEKHEECSDFWKSGGWFREAERAASHPETARASKKTVGRGLAGSPEWRREGTLNAVKYTSLGTSDTKTRAGGKGLCSLPSWRSDLIFGLK